MVRATPINIQRTGKRCFEIIINETTGDEKQALLTWDLRSDQQCVSRGRSRQYQATKRHLKKTNWKLRQGQPVVKLQVTEDMRISQYCVTPHRRQSGGDSRTWLFEKKTLTCLEADLHKSVPAILQEFTAKMQRVLFFGGNFTWDEGTALWCTLRITKSNSCSESARESA